MSFPELRERIIGVCHGCGALNVYYGVQVLSFPRLQRVPGVRWFLVVDLSARKKGCSGGNLTLLGLVVLASDNRVVLGAFKLGWGWW